MNENYFTCSWSVDPDDMMDGLAQPLLPGNKDKIEKTTFVEGHELFILQAQHLGQNDDDQATTGDTVRRILVADLQPNDKQENNLIKDLLEEVTVHSFQNRKHAKRFTIYIDSLIDINVTGMTKEKTAYVHESRKFNIEVNVPKNAELYLIYISHNGCVQNVTTCRTKFEIK